MASDHIGIEHLEWVRTGRMSAGELLRRLYAHVLDRCEQCSSEWRALLEGEQDVFTDLLAAEELPLDLLLTPTPDQPDRPSPYASAFDNAARKLTDAARAWNNDRARARHELARLLAVPPGERLDALRRARRRYRSPAFAHVLVEDVRDRVRNAPREALALLDLVRPTLELIPGALGQDWAVALELRAEAHRGNALRVTGDLLAAEDQFRGVRQRLADAKLGDRALAAEVASLEASLRCDQSRYGDAARLLDLAVRLYELESETEGLARALIKRAEIGQHFGRHEAAVADLERARALVDPGRQPFLHLLTTVALTPMLLDLGRAREVERILAEAEGAAGASEPWFRLRSRHVAGLAALELGELDRAEVLLDEAREGFLARELPYDAASVALDMALVALRQGRRARVRELAREIAPVFLTCGVGLEAHATLRLFAQAARGDAAAVEMVTVLRSHLKAARSSAGRAPDDRQPS